MAPFIMAEHPELSTSDVMRLSKEMMKGNRCRLIRLNLSFFGWMLLSVITAGVGTYFLAPYISAANAHFFNEISGKDYAAYCASNSYNQSANPNNAQWQNNNNAQWQNNNNETV